MISITFFRDNARWLCAGVLLTFMSSFGQTFFIAQFAGRIQSEFALSHGSWGGIYAAGTTASAIVMLWAGGLTDKFRVRTLAPIVFVALSVTCVAMALNASALALPFIIFFLRLMGQGMSSHVAMVAMSRWFDATRGRAISIALLGFSLAEATLPILIIAALTMMAWQSLWWVAAAAALVGAPAIMWLLQKERTPQSHAKTDQSLGMQKRYWTRSDALRHPLFWSVAPTIAGLSAFATAFFFHQIHFTDIKGWSHLYFVAQIPVYTVVSAAAMLVSGWAVDRLGTGALLPITLLPFAGGALTFAFAQQSFAAGFGFALLGLSSGAFSTVISAFWAEYYGTKFIGGIKAIGSAVMVFGSAMGPWLTGLAIDRGFGFDRQLVAVAVYFVATSLILQLAIRAVRQIETAR
mgnify:CR=1 FL=1